MRFDLRLHGETDSGKGCVMEGSVYASSLKKLRMEADKMAREGPWYFKGSVEPVPEGEKVTIHHVEQLKKKRRAGPPKS